MFALQTLITRFKKSYLLPVVFSGFVVGGPNDDVLSDAGKLRDFVYAESGNDVLVYTPSFNVNNTDLYDGGVGLDTLWLRLSQREFERPALRADLIRWYYHIFNYANVASASRQGVAFTFKSFNLTVRNIENILVDPINSRDITVKMALPKQFKRLKDSSCDSLT